MFKCEATNQQIGPAQRKHQLTVSVRPVKYVHSGRNVYHESFGTEPLKVLNVSPQYFEEHQNDEPEIVGEMKIVEVSIKEKKSKEKFQKEAKRQKKKKKEQSDSYKNQRKSFGRPRYQDDDFDDDLI